MAHEKVAGTPDTQFRSWRKKMESCLRECTNSTELKNWMMTKATHTHQQSGRRIKGISSTKYLTGNFRALHNSMK